MKRPSNVKADDRGARRLLGWLAIAAAAFWTYYYLLHFAWGPLKVDELYFAHVFWLMRQGLEPFTDFYSAHLPFYFWLVGLAVPDGAATDLSFVWVLRASAVLAALAYPALLYRLDRGSFVYLLPFLLAFLVWGRMAEIRPDTFGLLLFNFGWWWLLKGGERRHILLAALFSGLAVCFSARAAVMGVGMAAACAWLCLSRRDGGTFVRLALLGLGFASAAALFYAVDPARFELMIHSVYLEPSSVMPELTLVQRVLPFNRLILLVLIVAALGAAALALSRRQAGHRPLVIAIACATQLILILIVDPSPFQYVYGWAALPTLAGLALIGGVVGERRLHSGLAIIAAAGTAVMLCLSFAYLVSNGRSPRTGSILRITSDPPVDRGTLTQSTTPQLLAMMVSTEGQQALSNQLALLSEICGRIRGPALRIFYAETICLSDMRYDWPGLRWAPMFEGVTARGSRSEFERLIAERRPELVAWGKQHYRPRLNAWGRALLKDYEVYDGFALRSDVARKKTRRR